MLITSDYPQHGVDRSNFRIPNRTIELYTTVSIGETMLDEDQ